MQIDEENAERHHVFASEMTRDGKAVRLEVVAVRDADDPIVFRWEFRRSSAIVTRRSACTFSNPVEAVTAGRAVLHMLSL